MTAHGGAERVAVVVPVYGNEATLAEPTDRLGRALAVHD